MCISFECRYYCLHLTLCRFDQNSNRRSGCAAPARRAVDVSGPATCRRPARERSIRRTRSTVTHNYAKRNLFFPPHLHHKIFRFKNKFSGLASFNLLILIHIQKSLKIAQYILIQDEYPESKVFFLFLLLCTNFEVFRITL